MTTNLDFIVGCGIFVLALVLGFAMGCKFNSDSVTIKSCEDYDPELDSFGYSEIAILLSALYRIRKVPNRDVKEINSLTDKLRRLQHMLEAEEVKRDPSIVRQW